MPSSAVRTLAPYGPLALCAVVGIGMAAPLLGVLGVAGAAAVTTTATNVGFNLASEQTSDTWARCCRRMWGEGGISNQPLLDAMSAAFQEAIDELEETCSPQDNGWLRLPISSSDPKARVFYKALRDECKTAFERASHQQWNSEILIELDRGEDHAWEMADAYINKAAEATGNTGLQAHLVPLVRKALPYHLAMAFNRQIRSDDGAGTAAWREFQTEVFGIILAELRELKVITEHRYADAIGTLQDVIEQCFAASQKEWADQLEAELKNLRQAIDLVPEKTAKLVLDGIGPVLVEHMGPSVAPRRRIDNISTARWLPSLTHSFTGRKAELDRIRDTLGQLPRPNPSVAVIYGLSGIGKTQLSRQYVDVFNDQYDFVFWIPTSDSLLATSAYAQLADDLALPGFVDDDPVRSTDATIRWIEQQQNWLLVLDDADPIEMSHLIPRRGAGHVLVTSINPNWSAISDAKIALEGLLPEEAVSFLTNRTGILETQGRLEVGESFDYLPHALEQAAAYVESTGIDFAVYGQLLASHRANLLDKPSPFTDYPKSVYSAIEINVLRVTDSSPESMAVLAFVAFLGHSSIPRLLVRDAIESYMVQQEQAFNDYLFNSMIAECAKYSLIRYESVKFSVHSLIQAFILDSSTAETREGWNQFTLSCLSFAFPSDVEDSATWTRCDELIDHVFSAAGHAQFHSWADEWIEALYTNAGAYLHQMGRDDQAYEMLNAVYREREEAYGEDDPGVALAMNNLLNTLGDLDRGEEAVALGESAIQILTKDDAIRTEYEIELGKLHSNFGRIYLHLLHDPLTARRYFLKAYTIHRSILGEDHYTTGIDINNLGTVARIEGNWEEAHHWFYKAVAIHRSQLESNDYRLAIALYNLATASYKLGYHVVTRRLLREAIAMNDSFSRRSMSGAQLDAVSGLAFVIRNSYRPGESIALFDRAIDISTSLHGPDSLRTRKLKAERDEALALKWSPTVTFI